MFALLGQTHATGYCSKIGKMNTTHDQICLGSLYATTLMNKVQNNDRIEFALPVDSQRGGRMQ